MNFLKFIEQIFLFLLTFFLGTQTTYAKTELVLLQTQVVSSIEKNESLKRLEKQLEPSLSCLSRKLSGEKVLFSVSENVFAQNQNEFSCNFSNALQLSAFIFQPFYASEGWVDITNQGTVVSEKAFRKYFNGEKFSDELSDVTINPNKAPPSQGTGYRLGLTTAGGSLISKLDNFLTKPKVVSFLDDLSVFAQNNPTRISRYGNAQNLKTTLINYLENSQVINVKPHSQLIDDIENFMTVTRKSDGKLIEGATEYLDEMLQQAQKFKGGAFGLELLKNRPQSLVGKSLTKLEAGISDGDKFRFDMLFEDGAGLKIFVETKNYANTTSFSTSFYNQFKAYISNQNITSLDQIKYFFRANSNVTKAERVQKFKNMLLNGNKYEDIYDVNTTLFMSISISNKNQFKLLLESNNTSHQFFNFIEVY